MGVNCKIRLPLHTSSSRLFSLVQKLVCNDYKLTTHQNHDVDESLPPTSDNYWYPRYPSNLASTDWSGYSIFTLNTITELEYQWHFFFEEEEENWKVLHLPCDTFSQAIAKRIVDFFGGTVLYADYNDWSDKEHTYTNNNPKFPKKKKSQTSDERFLQFYQYLFQEKELNYDDFKAINKENSMTNEERELIEAIRAKKLYKSINQNLDSKITTSKKHKI